MSLSEKGVGGIAIKGDGAFVVRGRSKTAPMAGQ